MSKQITQSNHLKNYTKKIMALTKLYRGLKSITIYTCSAVRTYGKTAQNMAIYKRK